MSTPIVGSLLLIALRGTDKTMKCYQCGNDYQEKRGHLQLTDKWIGDYAVDAVNYYQCDTCGDLLFPPETIEILESKRQQILDRWINSQPLDSFLSGAQTASLLNISRQALHKHRRIRRSFIYQTKFDGRVVYLRESVLLFKQTGDGRFLLPIPSESVTSSPDVMYQPHGVALTPEISNSFFRSSPQLRTPGAHFSPQGLSEIPREDCYHA